MFFFLAGYFASVGSFGTAWLKKRTIRLLFPFLIWSGFYSFTNASMDFGEPSSYLFGVISGQSAPHLYFVVVLMQLTLITPLLAKSLEYRWGGFVFALTPAYLVAIYIFVFTTGELPTGYASLFPAWLVFYYGGMWIHCRAWRPRLKSAIIMTGGALTLSVIEAYALLADGLPVAFATSHVKASSLLFASGAIGVFLALQRYAVFSNKLLLELGCDSYGTYFSHMFWALVVAWLANKADLLQIFPNLPLIQLVESFIVVAAALVTIHSARRIFGTKLTSRFLGF